MTSIDELAKLVEGFHTTMERMGSCKRWSPFHSRKYHQTSLDHSLTLAVVTAYCLHRERELGGVNLDEASVITHAAVHDFCEDAMGDMTYQFKRDPRIKGIYKVLEEEAAKSVFARLQPLTEFLTKASILPDGSEEQKFFEAMELLDYMLYAIREVHLEGNLEFIKVFKRQHGALTVWSKRFKSVAELYSPEVQEWVQEQIETHPELAKTGAIAVPETRHLKDLLGAVNKLAAELVARGIETSTIDKLISEALKTE